MANVVELTNQHGTLFLRNDATPYTLHSKGTVGPGVQGGNISKNRFKSGYGYMDININGIKNPLIALRTTHPDDRAYYAIRSVNSQTHCTIYGTSARKRSMSGAIQYFIFTQGAKPEGNGILKLWNEGGALTFDSSWPLCLPVQKIGIGADTAVAHNLGHHPAFLILNQVLYNGDSTNSFTVGGIGTDGGYVRSGRVGAPMDYQRTDRFDGEPLWDQTINVLLFDVRHL